MTDLVEEIKEGDGYIVSQESSALPTNLTWDEVGRRDRTDSDTTSFKIGLCPVYRVKFNQHNISGTHLKNSR